MVEEAGHKRVEVKNLVVYSDNPRHTPVTNEMEAMELLWTGEKTRKKMMSLAKNIAAIGISPVEFLVAVPIGNEKGKYQVYDGNRRLSCLKVLKDPDKYNFLTSRQRSALKKAVEDSNVAIPESLMVYVTDEQSAFDIMKRLHLGEDDGRGRSSWGSEEKDRFNALTGGKKDEVQILLEKAKEYFGRNDLLDLLSNTDLKRMFYAPIRKALQISKDNPMSFTKDRVKLAIKLVEVAAKEEETGMKVSRWKVEDAVRILMPIIQEEIRLNPLSPIPKNTKSEHNSSSSISRGDIQLDSQKEDSEKSTVSQSNTNSKSQSNTPDDLTAELSNTSKIPREPYFVEGLDLSGLPIENQKNQGMLRIGSELKKFAVQRKVETFPFAAAFLLRAFVEAVLIRYLQVTKDKTGKPYWSDLAGRTKGSPKLSEIISELGKHNDDELFLPREQRRLFEMSLSDKHSLIEPLNLMVHHPESYAEPAYKVEDWPKRGLLELLNFMIKKISGQSGF